MNLTESLKDVDQLCHMLNQVEIHHTVEHSEDAALIDIFLPKERWEVSIGDNGITEIEIFKSDDNIYDESKLLELMEKYYSKDVQGSGCGCQCSCGQ